MTIETSHRLTVLTRALAALGVALALVPPIRAQDRGVCVAAFVPEPYALPDGTRHEAGRLSLCMVEAMSPVVGLHEVSVDGRPLGLARSRRARAEGRDTASPALFFTRGDEGVLELVGYVLPAGGELWSYALRKGAVAPAPRAPLLAVLARRF